MNQSEVLCYIRESFDDICVCVVYLYIFVLEFVCVCADAQKALKTIK